MQISAVALRRPMKVSQFKSNKAVHAANKGGKKGNNMMMPGGMQAPAEKKNNDQSKFDGRETEIDGADETDGGVVENLLQPGKKISMDDFTLVTVIGRGSFGKVFLAKKKDSGQPYAMKILKKDQLIKKNLLIKTQGKSFCMIFFQLSAIFSRRLTILTSSSFITPSRRKRNCISLLIS